MVRKSLYQIAQLILGEGISRAISFGVIIYIAQKLGPQELGLWAYTLALNSFLILLYNLGLDIYAMVEATKNPSKIPFLVTNGTTIKGFSLALLALSLPLLLKDTRLLTLLLLLLTSDFLQSLYPIWYYQVHDDFATITKIKISRSLFYLLSIIPLLWFWPSIEAVAFAYLVAHVVLVLFHARPYLAHFRWDQIAIGRWKEMVSQGLFLAGALIFTQVYNVTDKIMLTHLLDMTHTGWYEAGYKFVALSIVLFHLIWTVYAPKIPRTPSLYRPYGLLIALLALVVALLFWGVGEEVVLWLYGREFERSAQAMEEFALMVIAYGLTAIFISPLALLGKNREWFWITLTTASLNVILNYFLISIWGLEGAIIATTICELLAALSALGVVRKRLLTPTS
ncbi:MAG: oligosaccharide flippase family protein [Epsilonproteobacteria bacterium]|nr:hypothetical protein [Campylobacterota bacterium]NPA57210.1 oligosaccharide flippase family protein [Campylobacterota bacterium]